MRVTKLLPNAGEKSLGAETGTAASLRLAAICVLARATGLEPATTGSTVQHLAKQTSDLQDLSPDASLRLHTGCTDRSDLPGDLSPPVRRLAETARTCP